MAIPGQNPLLNQLPNEMRSFISWKNPAFLEYYSRKFPGLRTERRFKGYLRGVMSLPRQTAWIKCEEFPDDCFLDLKLIPLSQRHLITPGTCVIFGVKLNKKARPYFAAVYPQLVDPILEPAELSEQQMYLDILANQVCTTPTESPSAQQSVHRNKDFYWIGKEDPFINHGAGNKNISLQIDGLQQFTGQIGNTSRTNNIGKEDVIQSFSIDTSMNANNPTLNTGRSSLFINEGQITNIIPIDRNLTQGLSNSSSNKGMMNGGIREGMMNGGIREGMMNGGIREGMMNGGIREGMMNGGIREGMMNGTNLIKQQFPQNQGILLSNQMQTQSNQPGWTVPIGANSIQIGQAGTFSQSNYNTWINAQIIQDSQKSDIMYFQGNEYNQQMKK
ncbi:MAG: hypothetical protein EZS28_035991 [Streblomastix strix]|uniref:Uncharacterized protein n=1 Tax=Streblomastix strix TaxID=222440 RepID=A0A5J4UF08_9EUKA|nr:MAG: hypothetical protein EZS28_035991 [Streblomastix strix]